MPMAGKNAFNYYFKDSDVTTQLWFSRSNNFIVETIKVRTVGVQTKHTRQLSGAILKINYESF